MCLDKYGRWGRGVRLGTLMRQSRDTVWVLWDNAQDAEPWSQGDARYEVDRGRWRITGPGKLNPLEAIAGVSKVSPAPGAPALTSPHGSGKIDLSPRTERGEDRGERDMAEQSTLSAKQVATKLGTDAKTFRRFLRSSACTVEPVGQGGRYEFSTKDLEPLKKQFLGWRKPRDGATKTEQFEVEVQDKPKRSKKPAAPVVEDDTEEELEAFRAEATMDDEDEPSDEELAALEDLELDLEDLA